MTRKGISKVLDLLAVLGILHSYWGIDVAVFSPQLMFSWMHWGTYLLLMYVQGIVSGIWLFLRSVL